ncbi:protein-L-isoaspartate O-methyltransferase family protein [Marinicella litoralis]|uniref:Protein-L-isoaspartate O-methyltransferase n=1 Tax=Marinicella litoralis TaxID=644220 RepID=A0A4R6XLU4_9GAMM|nr:protein-L-isoaspartate O-methyltransferase [Marinicella litoralis]TDR20612.1 protein-L-isoaspartate(D-aspartate) O-methyltransferase [Marinicella litoralis]
MNFDKARHNMVTQQVRSWDVINKDILNAMLLVQREEFVQVPQRKLAFADLALPIGHNQSMMKPVVEGRMLQALDLNPSQLVLEVGTGSAYVTALISRLVNYVHSIDIIEDFTQTAKQKLKENQIENVTCETADFYQFNPQQKYDRVIITGALDEVPAAVFDWLNPDGQVFAIIGDEPIMEARMYQSAAVYTSHFDTMVGKLIKADQQPTFKL